MSTMRFWTGSAIVSNQSTELSLKSGPRCRSDFHRCAMATRRSPRPRWQVLRIQEIATRNLGDFRHAGVTTLVKSFLTPIHGVMTRTTIR